MGTWDIDLTQNKVHCSPEMLDIWELDHQSFNNDRSVLQAMVHPDDLEKMREAINLAIINDAIYEFEYRIKTKTGAEKWILSRGRYTKDLTTNRPIRFSGIVYDITEKKLKRDEEMASQKTRERFFMVAGHELRTPLTSLNLLLQVNKWDLENDYPAAFTKERIHLSLQKQEQHLSRITRIVDHILDEARIAEGQFPMNYQIFDMNQMILEVLEQFKITAEHAQVKVNYQGCNGAVGNWDRFRLEQALLNLLINALRYGNKKPIDVTLTRTNHETTIISVKDQGIGIRPEDQKRIFNRFERATNQDSHGIGLGLFITQNIVKAHQGTIQVKSAQDQGTEFTIELPNNPVDADS